MDTRVTCYLSYVVDAWKRDEFRAYAEMWLGLIGGFGGVHHGYFLPSEGDSNVALALFSFPSLAAYEDYRRRSLKDPECLAAMEFAKRTKCFLSYKRRFFTPMGTELKWIEQEGAR